MGKTLYFVTRNSFKAEEFAQLAKTYGFTVQHLDEKVEELQIADRNKLIRDKTRQAFGRFLLPVVVDHAGLHLECLAGMPGGLTQLFWDTLKGDKLCHVAKSFGNQNAVASCDIGFCDGQRIYTFAGEKKGTIVSAPTGARHFQWDTIFIPEGETRTYAEMTVSEKNGISQRSAALKLLLDYLKASKW